MPDPEPTIRPVQVRYRSQRDCKRRRYTSHKLSVECKRRKVQFDLEPVGRVDGPTRRRQFHIDRPSISVRLRFKHRQFGSHSCSRVSVGPVTVPCSRSVDSSFNDPQDTAITRATGALIAQARMVCLLKPLPDSQKLICEASS